jgi:hypothetical protein
MKYLLFFYRNDDQANVRQIYVIRALSVLFIHTVIATAVQIPTVGTNYAFNLPAIDATTLPFIHPLVGQRNQLINSYKPLAEKKLGRDINFDLCETLHRWRVLVAFITGLDVLSLSRKETGKENIIVKWR